jgi:hypothetical protein
MTNLGILNDKASIFVGNKYRMGALSHLNQYFWKYKWLLFLGIFFTVCANFFGVVPAQLVRYALDLVTETIDVECVKRPSAAVNASRSSETFAPGYSRYAMGFASSTVNDGTADPSVIGCGYTPDTAVPVETVPMMPARRFPAMSGNNGPSSERLALPPPCRSA